MFLHISTFISTDTCCYITTSCPLQYDLVEIKREFLAKYHKTLVKMIEGDTSGDYKRLLIAIVGRDV